jgi:hypothetical protein
MKPSQLARTLNVLINAGQPAFVSGPPGVGKSKVVEAVGEAYGGILEIRAPLMDPTGADLRFPVVDPKTGSMRWLTSDDFPRSGKGVLFIDEMVQATPTVMAGLSQLILDRRIGTSYKLPDGWRIVAAGNRDTDRAATNRMPSHIANRFTHLNFEVDHADWYAWAYANNIHPMVIAFLQFKPDLLHKFDPKLRAFPTPRSWHFMSNILNGGDVDECLQEVVAGTVGEGAATEFVGFIRVFRDLPDYDTIRKRPGGCKVPTDVAVKYAIASMLAALTKPEDMKAIMTYVARLPNEFQILATQEMTLRNKKLAETSAYIGWAAANKDLLLNATVR